MPFVIKYQKRKEHKTQFCIPLSPAFTRDCGNGLNFIDEPTSGLDPLMQNRFVELIMEEKKRGKTILMSSHLFEEVEKTCDRIGIIRSGQLVALDDAQSLCARHVKSYTVTLENEETALCFAKDFDGVQNAQQRNQVTVTAKQTLEEIFLHYYGEEQQK